jgi:hypothetical protein
MLVRSTWATHVRSRNGAGEGDGGNGTSRTVVRFVLGRLQSDQEAMIRVEMESEPPLHLNCCVGLIDVLTEYRDIVILPIHENMNSGKTHAFFTWAATNAWVPPSYFRSDVPLPEYSYADIGSPAPLLASHDPALAHADALGNRIPRPWVRPDMVMKCDDDTFVMLAELEARVRVELHSTEKNATDYWNHPTAPVELAVAPDALSSLTQQPRAAEASSDPLIYWGYLIKNRFMGGEIYGMSWALTEWVAEEEDLNSLTHGAEDKQTAKWMNLHPRREEVRWKSERCWIYNHPRSDTV